MPTTGPIATQPLVAPVSVANQASYKPLAPVSVSDVKQELSYPPPGPSHPSLPAPPHSHPPMAAPAQNGFPPRSTRPEPEQRVPRKLLPSNSTSSLFVTSAITNPDIDELVLSVATMLHCQMVRDEEASEQRKTMCAYFQEEAYTGKPPHKTIPDADTIYAFLRDVFEVGEFHAECAIILLVYINRLIGLIDLPLTPSNWKPVTVTALIIAQKVWDDNPLANADFSILYPALNVKQINALELKFLLLLQYKLTVTASLYARYYFELRTICDSPDMRTACKKPMTRAMAERAENRSKQASEQAQREKRLAVTKGGKFRSITAEDFALPDPKLIIS